jgi:hypothetical protein
MDEVAADTVAIIAKRVPADKRNLSMTDRADDWPAASRVCLFAAGHLLPAGDFSPLLMFRLHFSHRISCASFR